PPPVAASGGERSRGSSVTFSPTTGAGTMAGMSQLEATTADAGPELRDYLGVLRRRKNLIVLCVITVLAFTLVASFLETKIYEGHADVLLQAPESQSLFNPNTGQRNDPTRAVDTEIRVLKSQAVRDAVRAKLGRAPL